MYSKLTNLLLLIFIACLASSCNSDTPDNQEVSKGTEVTFAVSGQTRASGTVSFNKFAVYGDIKHPDDDITNPVILFNKTVVEYINDSWSYEGTQYWLPKYEHSFVAITPLSVLEADNNPQYLNSKLSFIYTIPTTDNNKSSDPRNITDILAATHRRLYNDNDIVTTTTFQFGHIMSRINLAPALDDNVMNNDEFIAIHKIELSGLKTKAKFNIIPASRQSNSQTDDRVINVTDQELSGNFTIELPKPVKVANNRENISLFGDNDAIIMIPQTFAADSDAQFILSYTINNESAVHQIVLPLAGKQWETGKSYTYKFTFSRKGLHSESTTIADWEVLNVGNFNAK